MSVKYSFYDTETGGMLEDGGHEQRYEQAFQLAIVAADESFGELEVHDLRARRKANYVPAAGAQATTRIHPTETDSYKTSEYDMATAMVGYIKTNPATIWTAWNMKYDTPVVRQTHFRNLYDPLPTTGSGNTRADGMRVAKALYCFDTETEIQFPIGYQGKPSLKLGNVAAANGIALIGAHDGVNDTRALMRVCALMAQKSPKTWEHMMNLRTAQGVDSFLSENLVFMWTPPDATTYYTSAFCYVANKGEALINSTSNNLKKSGNEILIANLAIDPETWRHKSDRELLLMLKGRDPENPSEFLPAKDQPFKVIKRNDQPVMWPYMEDPCLIPGDVERQFTDRAREVSKRRDTRLSSLTRAELESRRQLIQTDKELCDRLSMLADRMWKYWDREKQMWVERDTGPKLLEDRVYDGIFLNMPQTEAGRLRMLKNWFHSRPWHEREDIANKFGELFPKPDDALKKSDPVKYEQQQAWRDYTVTLKRLAQIVLYEQERVHDCLGAYLKDPKSRYWVELYVYQRLTEPSVDSKGEPLKKPKYRTLADAERLARADIDTYHREIEKKRQKNELTPDLAAEYARRIEMTEECLGYYEGMRANLTPPVKPVATAAQSLPVEAPLAPPAEPEQAPAQDDDAFLPAEAPAPTPTAAFKKQAKKPAPQKKLKKKPAAKKTAHQTPKKTPTAEAAAAAVAAPAALPEPIQGRLFGAGGGKARKAFTPLATRSKPAAPDQETKAQPAPPPKKRGRNHTP